MDATWRSMGRRWQRVSDSLFSTIRRSRVIVGAAVIAASILGVILLLPLIASHNPFDLKNLSLLNALMPPFWYHEGSSAYLLGTDDQGRDLLSAIIYGARLSLVVGASAVLLAAVVGTTLGLISGYVGGWIDSLLMRITEVQLTFPPILIALLVDGVLRGVMPLDQFDQIAVYVLIVSIGISGWPQYARTVRACTMVERDKEYIQAARILGLSPIAILFKHILPNVSGPVLVIATIHIAIAIILEATLSFLGVGASPTEPSLGTLVRIGNNFLFSGYWWITVFPAMALALLVLSFSLLGDWLRESINPKLRERR